MTTTLVIIGGMIGAPLRYLIDRFVNRRTGASFPWGTFTVNVLGAFALSLLAVGAARHAFGGEILAGLGIGVCGALSTYSTFSYETLRLLTDRSVFYALANLALNIGVGLLAVLAGAALATALW